MKRRNAKRKSKTNSLGSRLGKFLPERVVRRATTAGHWIWAKATGVTISVKKLARLLLDPNFERDGITILGGEPFAQADSLLALVRELREKGCSHIVCYSGYTLEVLREKAVEQPSINEVLSEIDILIDGAYVESLADGASLWTGSGNQHVIDLKATE